MALLLLSARPSLKTNARLVEAARHRGIELRLVDAVSAVASLGGGGGLDSGLLPEVENPEEWSVLARVGNWRPESMLALLESACVSGMKTLNPPEAIRCGRDHWRSLEAAVRAGLPVPRSLAGMDPEEMARAGTELLGFPLVVKLRRSRMGVGVMRAESPDQLEGLLDSLWRLGEEFILQEFIPAGGRSYRLLVLGARLLAAARFEAAEGQWRSNGARGGSARAWTPSGTAAETALRAAACLGLGLAGVDLLEGPDGLRLCEINPTPGFLRLEEATGIDVASAIVEAAAG